MPATKKKNSLEVKDRTYVQKGKRSASLIIRTKHDQNNPLQHVDSNGVPRSLRYCTNQKSIFMDEQEGDIILGRIVMVDGVLNVPKTNMVLQEFLEHHPHNGLLFEESDPEKKAQEALDKEELVFQAKSIVFNSKNTDELTAIAEVLLGSKVSKMKISEIKHDLIVEAQKNPVMFLDVAEDEDLQLLVTAKKALAHGVLTKKGDKIYADDSKIVDIPFGEQPEDILKEFLKSKEGTKVLTFIKKKLS